MTYVERLLALGATSVGGEMFLKHTLLGNSRNGDFLITPAGLELLGHALPAFALEPSAPIPPVDPLEEAAVERAVQVPAIEDEEPAPQQGQSPTAESITAPVVAERRARGRPKKQTPAVLTYAAGAALDIEL